MALQSWLYRNFIPAVTQFLEGKCFHVFSYKKGRVREWTWLKLTQAKLTIYPTVFDSFYTCRFICESCKLHPGKFEMCF